MYLNESEHEMNNTELNIEVANTRLGSESYRKSVGIQDGRLQGPGDSRILALLGGDLQASDRPALQSLWSQAHYRLARLLQALDLQSISLDGASPQRRETVLRLSGGQTPLVEAVQRLTGRGGRQAIRDTLAEGGSDEAVLQAGMRDGQLGDLAYALRCVPEIARHHRAIQNVLTRSQVRRLQDLLWVAGQALPHQHLIVEAQQAVDGLAGEV